MYYYLRGILDSVTLTFAVVDVGGVGYGAFISSNTFSKISPKIGQEIKLYTYFAVREDAMELYGFHSEDEKRAFEMLIGVSGIGPKAAIAILSVLTPEGLCSAVLGGDVKAISRANGVGQKTAARVVLELKDKIGKEFSSETAEIPETGGANVTYSDVLSDAQAVLLTLGYTRTEVQNALKGVDGQDTDSCVRQALRKLMK